MGKKLELKECVNIPKTNTILKKFERNPKAQEALREDPERILNVFGGGLGG